MSRTKSPPSQKPAKTVTNGTAMPIDVLTLDEAALYLRVSTDDVVRMIETEGMPGRKFGSEWRFFKSALQHWLGNPPRQGLLRHVGKIKDDPYLEDMLKDIYARRGRSETEER